MRKKKWMGGEQQSIILLSQNNPIPFCNIYENKNKTNPYGKLCLYVQSQIKINIFLKFKIEKTIILRFQIRSLNILFIEYA